MNIGDGKRAAENHIGDLFSLDQVPNLSSGSCLSYAVGVPMPVRDTGLVSH